MPPVTARPADGGQLITRAASADVGPLNYSRKLNLRRDLSDEIVREGWDYFIPLPDESDALLQPFPAGTNDRVNLIHVTRRPNGQAAVIVGTPTTLYRFNNDFSGYVDTGYVDAGYFIDRTRWEVIGSGFSENGRRWEAVDVDGETVFNNASDIPVSFRVEWTKVKPLYDLREQGVVCVGTIAEFNGMLVGGDITELSSDDIDEVLNLKRSGSITVAQGGFKSSGTITATSNGVTVTSTGDIFAAGDVNRIIQFSNGLKLRILQYFGPNSVEAEAHSSINLGMRFRITDELSDAVRPAFKLVASDAFFTADMVGKDIGWSTGESRRIIEFISSTQVTVDLDWPIASGEVFMENPLAYVGKDDLSEHTMDRRQYRVIWGEVGKASKFAPAISVVATEGTRILTTERTMRSIEQYEEVAVNKAGVEGGVLAITSSDQSITILSIGPGYIELSYAAQAASDSAAIVRKSSINSTAAFSDLQDDGGTILKIKALQNRVVVYKDTNFFVGRYTGDPATSAIFFERVVIPHGRGLYYRNTLVEVGGLVHYYAGKTEFYSFDLTSRSPQPVGSADMVSNLFYDFAKLDDTDLIYAVDNQLTQEIWTICPANTESPILVFDYRYKTFSTVDWAPTAAASVAEAVFDVREELGLWFLMGTQNGTVLQYGRSTQPVDNWEGLKEIFYRRSVRPYSATKGSFNAILSPGRMHFGDPYGEKHLEAIVYQLSSLQGASPQFKVTLYTSRNQAADERLLGAVNVVDSDNHGLVPVHAIAHFFRDEFIVDGKNNPLRLHMRTYDFSLLSSKSFHKRP